MRVGVDEGGTGVGVSRDWAGGLKRGFAVVIDPGSAKDPVTRRILKITTIRKT